MDIIHIANILLTRRCNLSCSYCNIVRNYQGIPPEYKKMDEYAKNELSGEEWIEIFDRLVANNPNIFFVIYGGEPFVYDDLWKIIKHCNENKIYYTIISNNTDYVQDRIRDVYEKCGQYRGFTSSVDPVVATDQPGQIEFTKSEKGKFFITEKSNHGLRRLIEMKQRGWIDDAVAEITIMRSTIPHLYNTVKKLSENGIYSSITTLDNPKNEYYDFARVLDMSEMVQKDSGIKEEFQKIKDDKSLLIHMPEMLNWIYNMLPSDGFCHLDKNFHNCTIDSNGSFRLCLRIRGVECPSLKLDDVISYHGEVQEKIKQAVKNDIKSYCRNCGWTCPTMSNLFSKQIIDHGPQIR